MVINGNFMKWQDCIVPYRIAGANNAQTNEFVWVGYDNSDARLPVAIAPTASALAEVMGVKKATVESMWSKFRHGQVSTAKYAKVYIGDVDDE